MPEESRCYTYRPLDFEHQGFRVAILQPAPDFSAPVCIDLIEVTLNNHPDYEAISYVWGDPDNRAPVQVGDAELRVTANLALALRYLRLSQNPRTLWADAICIDQSNIEERNRQVQLMKEIYSSCIRGLIWLGEASNATQKGIDSLARMKSLNLQRLTDRGTKAFSNKVALRELAYADYLALESIIVEPSLWNRVWVMQEIACSPEAVLIIGDLHMPWAILSSILDHSGTPDRYHLPFSHQHFEQSIWDAFAKTQVIEHQRDIQRGTSPLNSTLMDVLSRFRATHSTDPRDKIYGLLGLASDNLGIVPDYRKSVQDVFIDVARSQLNAAQNLDLVTQSLWPLGNMPTMESHSDSHSSMPPTTYVTTGLPSWLPNFSATAAAKILFAQRSIFAAGTPTAPQPVPISSTGVLTISGTALGTITTLKPTRNMTYVGGHNFSPWARDWLPDSLASSSNTAQGYPTGGDAFEAYWRTLMTDCVAFPSRRLSEDDIEEYSHLFNDWRTKIAELPLRDANMPPDKNDGDQALLYAMGRAAENAGVTNILERWRFAELRSGLYAMVPWEGLRKPDEGAKVGHLVVVARGGKVPLVLREKAAPGQKKGCDGSERWEVVGTAYVHGFMDGLAAEWVEQGKLKERDFDIV